MGFYKRVQKFKPVLKNMNRDICVIAKDGRDDYFYITVNHDGKINDIFARLYKIRKQWYVFYDSIGSRISVSSYTSGLNMLEGEILRCEA